MRCLQEICINLREISGYLILAEGCSTKVAINDSLLAGLRWQPHSRTSGVLGSLVLLWKVDELVYDFLSSTTPEICCLSFQRDRQDLEQHFSPIVC